MQRSIGKRILAVVAGVGLSFGVLSVAAPAAQAGALVFDESTSWAESGSDEANENEILADGWLAVCKEQVGNCNKKEFTDWDEDDNGDMTIQSVSWRVRGWEKDSTNDDLYEEAGESIETSPCWSTNNCPVGGALQVSVPEYMIQGVPQQLIVYASWRPNENTAGAPTNGDAVISMDGEPVAAAAFENGVATFKFTPMVPGLKNVTVSGVLNSNTSGANAWIDSVDGATMVLPYDPEQLEEALKNKKVEVGDTYTLEEIAQAKTALGKRLEWRVAEDSSDVCAVTTTKKGEVKAKFTESGKCSIIWTDPKTDEEGKYTFKVTE